MAFASSPQIASEPPVILQLPVTHGSPAAPFVGLAPPTVSVSDLDQNYNIISCSILVRRDSESNQEDVFQVIPRLAIHSSLKTPRGNASSVRIASLLQCLRTGIQFQSVVIENPLVTALITGTYPAPDSVGVSTTRVPDFSCDGYRGLTSGYQFLGELSQINLAVEHNHTQHSTAYTSGEIISTLLTPSLHDFFTIYGPMNVTPESNFILIFTVRNGSTTFLEPVLRHSQSFSESVLSFETDSIFSLDPSFHISDGFVSSQSGDSSPTSAYLEHINDAFQTPSFPDFSCITNWENCIVSPLDPQAESLGSASAQPHDTRETAIGENHGLHPSPQPVASSASVRYSPYSNRRRNRSSSAASVATRNTILLLLPGLTPPLEPSAVRDAEYAEGDLLKMIRNHNSMGKLLNAFGLDSSDLLTIHTFRDTADQPHRLSSKAVFKACGWNERTFRNKNSRYQNAEKAAKMEWLGEVPLIGQSVSDIIISAIYQLDREQRL